MNLSIHSVSAVNINKTEINNKYGKSFVYELHIETNSNENQDFEIKLFSKNPELKICLTS